MDWALFHCFSQLGWLTNWLIHILTESVMCCKIVLSSLMLLRRDYFIKFITEWTADEYFTWRNFQKSYNNNSIYQKESFRMFPHIFIPLWIDLQPQLRCLSIMSIFCDNQCGYISYWGCVSVFMWSEHWCFARLLMIKLRIKKCLRCRNCVFYIMINSSISLISDMLHARVRKMWCLHGI